MNCRKHAGRALLILGAIGACAAPVAAQTYPDKPIRLLIGFGAGAAPDIVGRWVAQKLSERWQRQVIVDNRVGATGSIAAGLAARAAPDGYTLFMASAAMVVAPFFISDVPYDSFKDFAPVIQMVELPTVLVVWPQVAATNVRELIALAKAKPGQLNYATAGQGTTNHIGAEALRLRAGIDITEVGYKTAGDALNGTVRGEVALYFPSLPAALPFIKQGRVRALGLASPRRSAAIPDLPTIAETLPGFGASSFYGILVPVKTPAPIITKLHDEITRLLADPEMREKMLSVGAEVVTGPPAVLTERMRAEMKQVQAVVNGIRARGGK